jgi:tetratricopeptide (TPR) repeat protein
MPSSCEWQFCEDAKAINRYGWKRLCQECCHEALDVFSRAIELDPNFAEAYNNRGIACRIAGAEGASDDEAVADALTMHDLEVQNRLRQQRKWMSSTSAAVAKCVSATTHEENLKARNLRPGRIF